MPRQPHDSAGSDMEVEQMAEREGVTEQLKTDYQMKWVAQMNNIRSRVAEIVNHDMIYN
ncbi:TnpV protein [Clostridiaceae bacterium]|nr:TnpV protein [Clostridiaceae bacterium]